MRLSLAAAFTAAAIAGSATVYAADEGEKPKALDWSFNGVLGTFDRNQLQRGLKVYLTICSGCHSLQLVAYRNLVDIGLTPAASRAIAAEKKVTEIGGDGQPKERPAELKDRFVSPFPNAEAAAASNNGKAPPDLSLIVKARAGGADYCHGILTGYSDPPKDWKDEEGNPKKLDTGQNYNKYFPGHVIAMPQPLASDGQVEYGPNQPKATIDQMAQDVCAFFAWTAEPTMEERKRTGIKVMLFLILLTGVFFVVYKRVWRNVH